MRLRIVLSRESRFTVLTLSGRLAGDGVAEFRRTVEASDRPIQIDLAELRSADHEGMCELRRVCAEEQAHVVNALPHVAMLLEADSKPRNRG